MKIVAQPDGSFLSVMTAEDASEKRLVDEIETIIAMAKLIEQRPHGPEDRARDRAGYWRYAEIEKSLKLVQGAASTALKLIKLIDCPEAETPCRDAVVQ